MAHDPLLYSGCAAHYLPGRPPYSAELCATLTSELGLDGRGLLVDVGCGPGSLAVELAPLFERVVGIDPDPDMLDEASRHARRSGRTDIGWRRAFAEDLGDLGLPPARVVMFGQSFHWTDRAVVAPLVHELLEPGGAIVLVAHDFAAQPVPPAEAAHPPIPHDEISELIATYLGPDYRERHRSPHWSESDRYEPALAATCFGGARTVHAPGRPDLSRDVDGVIAGYLSMSYAAPARFGARLDAFVSDLRRLLDARTSTGRFSDWPGDTALIIARKPASSNAAAVRD